MPNPRTLVALVVFALASTLGTGRASAGPRTGPADGPRAIEPSPPPPSARGGRQAASEAPPCERTASAYDDMATEIEAVFAQLRAEIANALAQADASIAAGADVDERLAAAEAELAARYLALSAAIAGCNPASNPAGCNAVLAAQANVDAAKDAREALVQEREQVSAAQNERKRLSAEDDALVKLLAKTLQELAKQKEKALVGCEDTAPTRAMLDAVNAVCGGIARTKSDRQGSTVVVVDKGERATEELAAIEQTLGASHRVGAGGLLAKGRAKLGAVRSALEKSEGKTLVIDGTGLLTHKGTTRTARAAQAVVAAALQLEPRIVVVRVETLDDAARSLAKSRGWRIAGDESDGIEREICRQ